MPVVEIPKEKWGGKIREVTLGATPATGGTRTKTVTVGGETTLPFLHFEGEIPHPPVIAIEIQDRRPAQWPAVLIQPWDKVMDDVAAWAKAAEEYGADIILLQFGLHDNLNPAYARQTLRKVLNATGLPLLVFGPGQVEVDNEILIHIAEEGKGENLVLGMCEDKNYRTVVAAALAHGHLVNARTPMDVNLAKQLNILISDMGLPLEQAGHGALGAAGDPPAHHQQYQGADEVRHHHGRPGRQRRKKRADLSAYLCHCQVHRVAPVRNQAAWSNTCPF